MTEEEVQKEMIQAVRDGVHDAFRTVAENSISFLRKEVRWQYHTCFSDEVLTENELDGQGVERWELVAVIALPYAEWKYAYYFKRQLHG